MFTPHVKDKVGSQQSDRADDREDHQVQHIEIKEVSRSSTLRDDAEEALCVFGGTQTRCQNRTREAHNSSEQCW